MLQNYRRSRNSVLSCSVNTEAFSSEHGDGRARSWLNETFFGRELYGLFKEVKSIFDPHNLLNPTTSSMPGQ